MRPQDSESSAKQAQGRLLLLDRHKIVKESMGLPGRYDWVGLAPGFGLTNTGSSNSSNTCLGKVVSGAKLKPQKRRRFRHRVTTTGQRCVRCLFMFGTPCLKAAIKGLVNSVWSEALQMVTYVQKKVADGHI